MRESARSTRFDIAWRGSNPVHALWIAWRRLQSAIRVEVGKGATAPCPPSNDVYGRRGWRAEPVVGRGRASRRLCLALRRFAVNLSSPAGCARNRNEEKSELLRGWTSPNTLPPFSLTTFAAARSSAWPNA